MFNVRLYVAIKAKQTDNMRYNTNVLDNINNNISFSYLQ